MKITSSKARWYTYTTNIYRLYYNIMDSYYEKATVVEIKMNYPTNVIVYFSYTGWVCIGSFFFCYLTQNNIVVFKHYFTFIYVFVIMRLKTYIFFQKCLPQSTTGYCKLKIRASKRFLNVGYTCYNV